MRLIKQIILIVAFLSITSVALTQGSGTLLIEINSFRNDDGNVAIALFSGEEGFPGSGEAVIMATTVEIKDGTAVAKFENLDFGEYAISAFHDENKNDDLDTNWLGIPKEGVAASNNAKGKMGPPKYKDARFDFSKDLQAIVFDMDYIF